MDMQRTAAAPRPSTVAYNDWPALPAAPREAFVPAERVSVVIPYRGPPAPLALTLAALERQRFPRDLLEVVVVDDGSAAPVGTPPAGLQLRVVRGRGSRGASWARNAGVAAARHDIVVFLDGDMVAGANLLAAHARWHEAAADVVTVGFGAYVEAAGIDAAAVRAHTGDPGDLFAGRRSDRPWTERHLVRTDNLTSRHDDLFRAVVGHNFGIRRAFFDALGGFDEGFTGACCEDTEFAYRAYARGAVFVPVRDALAWHQGRFTPNLGAAKRRHRDTQRRRAAGLVPLPDFRRDGSGGWAVPRTVVSVHAAGPAAQPVVETVGALFDGDDRDLAVRVVLAHGTPADALPAALEAWPLARLVRAPDALEAFPATPFHVDLPAGAPVRPDLLRHLRRALGDAVAGTAELGAATATVHRVWALHRARRTGLPPTAFGDTVAIDARPRRRVRRPARRRRGRLARVRAELLRTRRWRDVRRVAGWLAAGLAWALRRRAGLRRQRRTAAPPPPGGGQR